MQEKTEGGVVRFLTKHVAAEGHIGISAAGVLLCRKDICGEV